VHVTSIRLQNFRSFVDSGRVELGRINVLIGANNSGKSSILRGIHQLQTGLHDPFGDVRSGSTDAHIEIELANVLNPRWGLQGLTKQVVFSARLASTDRRGGGVEYRVSVGDGLAGGGDPRFPNQEPHHFILPYLSRRKTGAYGEDIREQNVTVISSDMSNLSAKLSRLANPQFPAYSIYSEACKQILGFVVTSIPSLNGQHPGIFLPDQSSVPITQMGEGVPNIVYLLANLATAKGKLFLIEEPENDLHPRALKALLDLILQSESNQFVISTHSNIVVSRLCSTTDSKLFRVTSPFGELPTTAHIEEVAQDPRARTGALQELGYSFSDVGLWEGWLILEESSAERIIRDYLIPWFAPTLTGLRTMAAGGANGVEPAFEDLRRLILFTYLQPAYEGRAWVRVDGDEIGKGIISSLRLKYPSVAQEHFDFYDLPQFEYYYPARFSDSVARALAVVDKQAKRKAKRQLLLEVVEWINSNPEVAKLELMESARSVITDLRYIEARMQGAAIG